MLVKDITYFCKKLLFPDFCQGQCVGFILVLFNTGISYEFTDQIKYRGSVNLDGYLEQLLLQNNRGLSKLQLTRQ